jgi:hypothetical protein
MELVKVHDKMDVVTFQQILGEKTSLKIQMKLRQYHAMAPLSVNNVTDPLSYTTLSPKARGILLKKEQVKTKFRPQLE